MSDNLLVQLSVEFAVKIVKLTDEIQGKGVLKNQILKSGTSIGANIHEANYAQSKADFVSKLQIALKECSESEYWLELLLEGGYTDNRIVLEHCVEVKKILIASINTAKNNK